MPPRARSPSPPNDADQPPANRPRQHVFHPNFEDEDSDIIIRSSDGTSFALQRIHLQANSEVFKDMLTVANEEPQGAGLQNLPVVDITEKKEVTELFLRQLVSTKYLVNSEPPSFHVPGTHNNSVHLLDSVLSMCLKYHTPSVRSVLIQLHLPKLMRRPLCAFALAVAHGQLSLAKDSIRLLSGRHIDAPGCSRWSTKNARIRSDQRDACLADIPSSFISRLPATAISSFCSVQAKVVGTKGPSHTWDDAADEFTLW